MSRRPQLLILIPAVPCGTELSGSTGNSSGNVKTVTESVLSDLDVKLLGLEVRRPLFN